MALILDAKPNFGSHVFSIDKVAFQGGGYSFRIANVLYIDINTSGLPTRNIFA